MVALYIRWTGTVEEMPRGCWRGAIGDGGRRSATIRCVSCGELVSLVNHTIDGFGNVTPSVVCPTESCANHGAQRPQVRLVSDV